MTKEGATLLVMVMLLASFVLLAFGVELVHLAHHIGHELNNVTTNMGSG